MVFKDLEENLMNLLALEYPSFQIPFFFFLYM